MTAQTLLDRARQYLNPTHPPIGRQTDHTRDDLISELLSLCESLQSDLSRHKALSEDMEQARFAWVRDLAKANLPYPGKAGLDGFAAGWDDGFAAGSAAAQKEER
jgi:hypothetical protein